MSQPMEPALAARFHVRFAVLGSDAGSAQRELIEAMAAAERALRAVGARRYAPPFGFEPSVSCQ